MSAKPTASTRLDKTSSTPDTAYLDWDKFQGSPGELADLMSDLGIGIGRPAGSMLDGAGLRADFVESLKSEAAADETRWTVS